MGDVGGGSTGWHMACHPEKMQGRWNEFTVARRHRSSFVVTIGSHTHTRSHSARFAQNGDIDSRLKGLIDKVTLVIKLIMNLWFMAEWVVRKGKRGGGMESNFLCYVTILVFVVVVVATRHCQHAMWGPLWASLHRRKCTDSWYRVRWRKIAF